MLLYSCMLTKLCKMYCHWSELKKFTFFVHVSSIAHQQPRKLSGSHDCRTAVFRDSCQIWKVLSSGTSTYSWCSGLSNFVSFILLVLKFKYLRITCTLSLSFWISIECYTHRWHSRMSEDFVTPQHRSGVGHLTCFPDSLKDLSKWINKYRKSSESFTAQQYLQNYERSIRKYINK